MHFKTILTNENDLFEPLNLIKNLDFNIKKRKKEY